MILRGCLMLLLLPMVVCSLELNGSQKLDKNIQRTFYVERNGNGMMELIYFTAGFDVKILDCYSFGDSITLKMALPKISKRQIHFVDSASMSQLTEWCLYEKWNGTLYHPRNFNNGESLSYFKNIFIYPGTKWCGPGNISESYDDLGPSEKADKCCRDHDHCDHIPGFGEANGLTNTSPFTRCHCDWDHAFHRCLQEANTETSHNLGNIFFNILQQKCFKKEHPIVKCLEYKGLILRRSCQEYELDEEKESIWQFFDAKYYEMPDRESWDAEESRWLPLQILSTLKELKLHQIPFKSNNE